MPVNPNETIDFEAFSGALTKLRRGGAESTAEEASVREKYGHEVADDMAHGSPGDIGHALVELLGTLPGSSFSTEVKSKQHSAGSLVSSYRAVDAELDRKGEKGLLEATVDELNTDQPGFNVRRSGEGNTKCSVNLTVNEKAELKGGSVWFRIGNADQKVEFAEDGFVGLVRGGKIASLAQLEGKKINIAKLMNLVTDSSKLGKKGDVEAILKSVVEQVA